MGNQLVSCGEGHYRHIIVRLHHVARKLVMAVLVVKHSAVGIRERPGLVDTFDHNCGLAVCEGRAGVSISRCYTVVLPHFADCHQMESSKEVFVCRQPPEPSIGGVGNDTDP